MRRCRAALMLLPVLLAGCAAPAASSSGSTPSSGASASSGTTLTTPAGSPSSAPSTSATTATTAEQVAATAPTGSTVSLPLTTHDDKGIYFTVEISVGGGAPFAVVLDTGSTGLYVEQGAVGPSVTAPTPAQPFSVTYAKGGLTGTLQSAVVDLGGVSTSGPVTFGTYTSGSGNSSFLGAKGIMGIAAGSGGQNPTVMAVQGLLPAPYSNGSTLTGAQLDGAPGSWVLGPVAAPAAGAVQVPLIAEGSGEGVTAWGKDVSLCWAFNQGASSCGATDLDSGAGSVLLGEGKPGVPAASEAITDIAITTPSGASVWSFAPGSSTVQTDVMDLGGETVFNTSNHIYLGRTIAFDYIGGTLTIGPATS